MVSEWPEAGPQSGAVPSALSETTFPARASFTSFGFTAGSCSNTSRPAPAMSPDEIRRTNAFSSITSPRAVLTMKASGRMSLSRRADSR